MPIPLNSGGESRPNVKLPTIGSGIEVSVVGTRQKPWMQYKNPTMPEIGKDGKPRKQLVMTGVVVSHAGASVGTAESPRQPQVGDIVDCWFHGHQWGLYIEGEKAYNTAGFTTDVGDIVLWHYTHDEPSQEASNNDKKVRTVTFRKPRPEEAHHVAAAEAAYWALGFDKPDTEAPPAPQQPGPFDQGAPGTTSYQQQPQQYPQQYPQQPPPQQYPQQPPQQQYPQQPQPGTSAPGYGQPGQAPQQPAPAPAPAYGQQPQQGVPGPGF